LNSKKLAKKEKDDLVKRMWDNRSPKYLKMLDDFIVEHFNSEDKDLRKDAHKALFKVFDTQVAKKADPALTGANRELSSRFVEALNSVISGSRKSIEVEAEDAIVLDDKKALEVRNATRRE
jgi:hypothetical protein